jgi:hypothetical protein
MSLQQRYVKQTCVCEYVKGSNNIIYNFDKWTNCMQ